MILKRKTIRAVLAALSPIGLISVGVLISFRVALLPALTGLPPRAAPTAEKAPLASVEPRRLAAGLPGHLPVWQDGFDYPDGLPPDSLQYFGMGGTRHALAVERGRLNGRLDTNFYFNQATLQWSPEGATFGKEDLFSLAFSGVERQGLIQGNWYHRLRIVPENVSIDTLNMTSSGIELLTQERFSGVWARAYLDSRLAILKEHMYTISSGEHSYLLEINHVSGKSRPGALRFYRDGVLVVSGEGVQRYLSDSNQVRFLLYSDDPNGASYAWDDVRIWISAPPLEPGAELGAVGQGSD